MSYRITLHLEVPIVVEDLLRPARFLAGGMSQYEATRPIFGLRKHVKNGLRAGLDGYHGDAAKRRRVQPIPRSGIHPPPVVILGHLGSLQGSSLMCPMVITDGS